MVLDLIAQAINALIALGLGVFLLRRFLSPQTRNLTTLFWMVAFFTWSLQIGIRIEAAYTSIEAFLLLFITFFFLIQGAILLMPRQLIAFIGYLPVMLIFILTHFQFEYSFVPSIFAFLYLFSYGLYVFGSLGRRLGGDANWLMLGWMTMLIANLVFFLVSPKFPSHLLSSVAKIFMIFGMSSPRLAHATYIYERKAEGIGKVVILSEENRRALAREAEKKGLHNQGLVRSQRRFQRIESISPGDDFVQRLLQSFLDVVIVSILTSSREITGYEIVLHLHQKYRILYSPGTIYPILRGMQKRGLIKSRISGHKKPYLLTDKGKQWYETISNQFPEVMKILMIR